LAGDMSVSWALKKVHFLWYVSGLLILASNYAMILLNL